MLTEQKEKAITRLLKGDFITDICKDINISRPSLYAWRKDPEFIAELEARRKEIIKSGNDFIVARTNGYLEQLNDLAMNSTDARTKASVLTYLVDRALGKTVSRIELEPVEMAKIPSRQELENEFKTYKTNVVIDNSVNFDD
jgi:hypothetical protein